MTPTFRGERNDPLNISLFAEHDDVDLTFDDVEGFAFFGVFVRTNVRAWLDRDNHFVKFVGTLRMGIDADTSLWCVANGLTEHLDILIPDRRDGTFC